MKRIKMLLINLASVGPLAMIGVPGWAQQAQVF